MVSNVVNALRKLLTLLDFSISRFKLASVTSGFLSANDSQPEAILPNPSGAIIIVTARSVLLESSGWGSGILLNMMHCNEPPTPKNQLTQIPAVEELQKLCPEFAQGWS